MKYRIKNIILPFVGVAALFFAACSDWVEPESLDVHYPSLEEENPELYKQYMQSLRDYKSQNHKVMFVTIENPADGARPNTRNQHLTTVPDSVDFIVLTNPTVVHSLTADEIQEVHKKGTRTLYFIDFAVFESEWVQLLKADPALTEEEALAYFTERTEGMLALCDKWKFDGVIVCYTGRALVGIPDTEIDAYNARQLSFLTPILAWREAHKEHVFSFMGNANYLLETNRAFLDDCDYIIVPTDAATNYEDVTFRAMAVVGETGIPSDRIIVTAQSTRPGDSKNAYGYFSITDGNGNQVRSVYGCAEWVGLSSSFVRAGLMVKDAQYDYYNQTLIYPAVREAIGIMNPSPKN